MLKTALNGVAGARLAALAAALACALSGCGGEGAKTAGPEGTQTVTVDVTGGPAAQRPDGAAQATAAAAASTLDTSGWIVPPPFYAAGDEPFWRLDIVDGWFSFKRSGLAEIEAPLVQPSRAGGADVFDSPPLKVALKREACEINGGRGDIGATVTFDGIEFGGCAFAGAVGAAVANSAEAASVVESVKVIDACLAKLGDPALVTAVYPREGERTAVALRAKDGSLYECAVEPDGSTIAFLDAVEPRSAGPWMSRMRFLRSGVLDATKCADAEVVRSGDKALGRLLPKSCKF